MDKAGSLHADQGSVRTRAHVCTRTHACLCCLFTRLLSCVRLFEHELTRHGLSHIIHRHANLIARKNKNKKAKCDGVTRHTHLHTKSTRHTSHTPTKGERDGVTLIVKPNTLSRGRGIYLTKTSPPRAPENLMVQIYVSNPLLIDGLKFDLRLYVLITDTRCSSSSKPGSSGSSRSINISGGGVDTDISGSGGGGGGGQLLLPRVFLHHEGLVRFCTAPYETPAEGNLSDATMHLSNYSVNKWSAEYVKSGEVKQELEDMQALSEANGCERKLALYFVLSRRNMSQPCPPPTHHRSR
jgi:hypothetical protein